MDAVVASLGGDVAQAHYEHRKRGRAENDRRRSRREERGVGIATPADGNDHFDANDDGGKEKKKQQGSSVQR